MMRWNTTEPIVTPVKDASLADGLTENRRLTEEEFHALYLSSNRPIYNFFANRGHSKEECRDLVQDTFFEIYRGLGAFRGDSSLLTWSFSIAKKVWLTHLRKKGRLKRVAEVVSLDQVAESGPSPAMQGLGLATSDEPLAELVEEEALRRVRAALAALPPKMRLCSYLYFVEARKSSEIADLLGVSDATVRSQVSQARDKLKRMLDHDAKPA
jgi:RNA polymerase sigma-70 factor (ECF subfamily)